MVGAIRGIRKAVACALLLPLAAACSTPPPISVAQEKALGRQAEGQFNQNLMRDAVVVKYVRDLGNELTKAAKPSPFKFNFYVVEDRSLNAFAIPGGSIYVHTGLILKVKNASELAGVVSHEIGHATARHVAQSYTQRQRIGFFANLLGVIGLILSGGRVDPRGATSLGAYAYAMSFSREFESEADSLGVETMYAARWDPNGLPDFFETLQAESEKGGYGAPGFLRSHPFEADRAAATRKQIAELGPLPADLKRDDEKLRAIQARIRSLMGADAEDPKELEKKKNKQ
jgi:beta-barrel assembly-enhancing protease